MVWLSWCGDLFAVEALFLGWALFFFWVLSGRVLVVVFFFHAVQHLAEEGAAPPKPADRALTILVRHDGSAVNRPALLCLDEARVRNQLRMLVERRLHFHTVPHG